MTQRATVPGVLALLLTIAATAASATPCGPGGPAIDLPTFHGDARRLGWNAEERHLGPTRVGGPDFGPLWSSPALDAVTLDGRRHPAHLYATPLYLEDVRLTAGRHTGGRAALVFAASSSGWVHAVAAGCGEPALPPGAIAWATRLGSPVVVPALDGGVPLGVLSTPTIDRAAIPPRLYVTALDATHGWRVFALDLGDGGVLPGWPLTLDPATLGRLDGNAPAPFGPAVEVSQRAALALAPGGAWLYVAFGTFRGTGPGWMVAIDTRRPAVAGAFAGARGPGGLSSAGMWGSGGPALDADGRVYMTTGNSPGDSGPAAGVWGNSLLVWAPPLTLTGTYTPFNYCGLDRGDMDLGGSAPLVLPDLDPATTATPRLVAFGGKQGTVYLLDRDRLPGRLDRRPPCGTDAAADRSLLPPWPQPQFGRRGPLLVFGPYTETHARLDHARMRSTPAYFRDATGAHYLFVTGAAKAAPASLAPVPPGLARLRVVTAPGAPAHLAVDAVEGRTTFWNPGPPVVSSAGPHDAVVWVLDSNQPRTAALAGPGAARPVLYAFDAATLALLWRSAPGALEVGGKYSAPTVARGRVFVGTDRIQAFGLRPR